MVSSASLQDYWIPMIAISPVLFLAVVVEFRGTMRGPWVLGRAASVAYFVAILYQMLSIGGVICVSLLAIYVRGNIPRVWEGLTFGVEIGAVFVIAFNLVLAAANWLFARDERRTRTDDDISA
jgi:apolipoprotein N-acyltransferase